MQRRLASDSRLILASLAAVVVTSAAIGIGALDRLAPDGDIYRRSAVGALCAYWLVLFALVWLVPRALRWRKQTALVVVASAVALAAFEIAARALVPRATAVSIEAGGFRSRELHHIYPGGARIFMGRFEGKDVFLETNEDGLRTPYSAEEFAQFQERIIALGDSFTFGFGVAGEEAFPARLEGRLREMTGRNSIAVLNAGIISYSPFLQKLLLERRLLAYKPTLVVVFLDVTDIGDDHRYMAEFAQSVDGTNFPFEDARPPRYRGALPELIRPYHRRLASALQYPVKVARSLSKEGQSNDASNAYDYYDFEITVADKVERNRFFVYRHPLSATRHFFDQTMSNVDEIARVANEHGAGFLLVVTPRFHHWNPEESPENWERPEYALNEPHQFEYFRYFQEAERPYPVVDLLPDFQMTNKYPLIFREDPHWNAAGHEFVADTMAQHLLNRRLIGGGQ